MKSDDFGGADIQLRDDVPGAVVAPPETPEREIDKNFDI